MGPDLILSVPAERPVGQTVLWNGVLTLFCDTSQRRSGAWAITPNNFDKQSLRGLIEVEIGLDQEQLVLLGSGQGSRVILHPKRGAAGGVPPADLDAVLEAAIRANEMQVMVVGLPHTATSFDVGAANYCLREFKRRCDEGA